MLRCFKPYLVVALIVLVSPCSALSQLRVTEVMYDPASNESRWEWIEVYNPLSAPVDLAGYMVDRVGDAERAALTLPNIRSLVDVGGVATINTTIVPAGGVAVLYNGPELGYNPDRFRAAWPQTPAGATLIGMDGWASNQLNNSPTPSIHTPHLPGRTVGFWPNDASYRIDTSNVGTLTSPNNKVVQVDNAAFSFSYDDNPPWPDNTNAASISLTGGDSLNGAAWHASTSGLAGAYQSTQTFELTEPINGADFGSPGVAPPLTTSSFIMTEVMYNPASASGSKEWEWVELYNGGANDINFHDSPYWFDDDDGANLSAPNVASGLAPAGGLAVLFNASAATIDQMRAAWQTPTNPLINFIPVSPWPGLNNTGDVAGLWENATDYLFDRNIGDSVSHAAAGVVYDNSAPWPTDNNADSITLKSLIRTPSLGSNWTRATGGSESDPSAYPAQPVFSGGSPDNSGMDIGSPGWIEGLTTPLLPGDYNGDGQVNAADYTRWRDGGPLLNETASLGLIDMADYDAWRLNYGATAAGITIPEPTAMVLLLTAIAFKRRVRCRID